MLSVQSLPDMPPTVKITGADAENIDFEVIVWDPAGTSAGPTPSSPP